MDGIQNISKLYQTTKNLKYFLNISNTMRVAIPSNYYFYISMALYLFEVSRYTQMYSIKNYFSNCKLHQNTLLKMLLTFKKFQIIENTKHIFKYQYKQGRSQAPQASRFSKKKKLKKKLKFYLKF